MFEADEFRIKMLTRLRTEGGWVWAKEFMSHPEILKAMKQAGWIWTRRPNQVKISMKGRRALRCFERMYREG